MTETVVACGGARAPRRAGKVVSLAVSGAETNVRLESEDIGRRMLQSLSGSLADLLEVATYVYAADQLVSRGGATAARLGSDWRRDFQFIIPVREPDRWSSPDVVESLERLLSFMSEDRFRFDFIEATEPSGQIEYFDFGGTIEEVVLFSGGLDSLAGAVDRLSTGYSDLLLVSHQSSTKIANRQKQLAEELATRFGKRVVHVPVRIRMRGVTAVERTQRTRSFLFGCLGAAVARIAGAKGFSLFENGIVSFNLPIARQVVGAAATRTTHPRVVHDLSVFLSTVLEREVTVQNDYLWHTKGEVAGRLRDAGHADLAKHSVSCSRVHLMSKQETHCGTCSQCLDRRFGVLAAGFGEDDPAEIYEVDLLTGARENDIDRTMAESFVRHALELGDLSERIFVSRFAGEIARAASCIPGMSADDVAREMLSLHHRHAAAIQAVLAEGYQNCATALAAQTLPPTSILRLVAGPNGIVAPPAGLIETAVTSGSLDARDFRRSSQLRIALDPQGRRILIDGMPPVEAEANFKLLQKLVAVSQRDRQEGRAPENHTFTKSGKLAHVLGVSEPTLRRSIYRLRLRVSRSFEVNAGLPIAADALIQNHPWKGYRINPAVLILSTQEIGAGGRSRLERTGVTTQ